MFEVTSPSTRKVDLQIKILQYAQIGVQYYFIIDIGQKDEQAESRILGYHLQQGQYRAVLPNAQGWFWLPPLGIWMGLEDSELWCYDTAEQRIGNYKQVNAAWKEAEARVEAEIAERILAEEQANYAISKAIDEAQARAKAEVKAQEAKAQAEKEAQRRVDLEAQMQEMAAELRCLRGDE